jgi:hypothetical protein
MGRAGRIGLVAGLVVGGLAVVAPAAAEAPSVKVVTGSFAGTVEDSDAYVAVYVDEAEKKGAKREVTAYVCDGAEISEWFDARVKGNTFTLTSDEGARLKVKLTEDEASGSFRPEGDEKLKFAAPVAEDPAGLYRGEDTTAGDDYLGGLILLPDGMVRGQIERNGINFIDPGTLNVANPMFTIPGVGGFTAMRTD